ncbi:tRNA(fMet)-specific endonuclease VapC [Aquisphaera giovannonii]|uniref:Ribonuclease VapC n=1 Tax=Aquisphaera giovannonii TaxID=406548 RepID=A0A5B9WG43_9BACT|nr:type II toxin-antitoxin system VapC family toxin [Aquisphaera giovannonii]QEH39164.1 tRNA(fMet)-specific endonuclease VapC [Aquisphaera giovannonii]
MSYLVDTSILGRLANSADPSHAAAAGAVVELHRRGEILHVTAQVLIEFRNVATRPLALNGLGLGVSDAGSKAAVFESSFPLLDEIPAIYPAWKALVGSLAVVGKQVHDARLVAVCHAHGVTHLLTFNVAHFTRLANFGPALVVADPTRV